MAKPRYDIFISYRRDHSEFAQLVFGYLKMRGYKPFLDVRGMPADVPFDKSLLRVIEESPYFLLLLTPGCLERCVHPDDWVRRELFHALQTDRRILQLRSENCARPHPDDLPAELERIKRLPYVTYSNEHSDASLSRLCRFLTSPWRFRMRAALILTVLASVASVLTWGPLLSKKLEQQRISESTPSVGSETAVDDGLVSPHFNSAEAVDLIKASYREELADYDLIDLIGSFYVCLGKPERIFHRFPEWLCVFRHRQTKELVQLKLTDSRVPKIPRLEANEYQKPGWITYFSVSQQPKPTYRAKFFDALGRMHVMWEGEAPLDRIEEVISMGQSTVVARMQIYGGQVERTETYRSIEQIGAFGTVEVRKAPVVGNVFYEGLSPIDDCEIGVGEAIRRAVAKGAKGSVPDKEGKGGSGVVRLYSGRWDDESERQPLGPYWHIPYRIGISPVLVNANNGDVYWVSDRGNYEIRN